MLRLFAWEGGDGVSVRAEDVGAARAGEGVSLPGVRESLVHSDGPRWPLVRVRACGSDEARALPSRLEFEEEKNHACPTNYP